MPPDQADSQVPSPPMIPDDVSWARGVKFHLQSVLTFAGMIAAVSFLGTAAVMMAGHRALDPPITAGVIALTVGGIAALAGAVIAGIGQLSVLRAAGATNPEAPAPTEVVEARLAQTRARLSWLPKLTLAACVVVITTYALALPAGLWGAVIGCVVVAQVAAGTHLVRVRLLSAARLHRS